MAKIFILSGYYCSEIGVNYMKSIKVFNTKEDAISAMQEQVDAIVNTKKILSSLIDYQINNYDDLGMYERIVIYNDGSESTKYKTTEHWVVVRRHI